MLDIVSDYLVKQYGFPENDVNTTKNQIFTLFNQFGFVGDRGQLDLNLDAIRNGMFYGVRMNFISRNLAAQLVAMVSRLYPDPSMDMSELVARINDLKGSGSQDMRIIGMAQALINKLNGEITMGSFPERDALGPIGGELWGAIIGTFVFPVIGTIIAGITCSCGA